MLNIAPTTLNGYIKNNRQPDFELVKQIAAELEVSIDYLFEYDNSRNELIPTPKEKQLLLQLRSLDDNQMKIIYDLIQLTYNNNQN